MQTKIDLTLNAVPASRATRFKPKRAKSLAQKAPAAAGLLIAHLLPLTLFFTGTNAVDWIVCAAMYVPMVFAVGAGLHRYFSHKAFRTSRVFQFLIGWLACSFFGDPIGFTGKHRLHHRHSDTENDAHTPRQGLWHCWVGSLLDDGLTEAEVLKAAKDLTVFPELMWLHRFYFVPAIVLMAVMFAVGGYTMLVAGYLLPWCLVAVHGPCAVNYFCHRSGRRRYGTKDDSTNNVFVAVYLLGEGWHNNHHYYPGSARAGFVWYEVDVLYYILKLLSWLGVIWDLRETPEAVIHAGVKSGR